MRIWFVVLLAVAAAGCRPPKDAEIVSAYEPKATIGVTFTADTTRLVAAQPGAASEPGVKALAAVLSSHLAAVGKLRDDKVEGDHIDLVADVPAPGFALRARVTPKLDLLCQVTVEPITAPLPEQKSDKPAAADKPVSAAPWSVHNAFNEVVRLSATLQPSRLPPMSPERFARLRGEAAVAAQENKDPWLTSQEYVRVPRPISNEGVDRPYWTPPAQSSKLLGE